MRKLLTIVFALATLVCSAQAPLIRFTDSSGDRYGYKDSTGKVRIPLSRGYARAEQLHQITAISGVPGTNYHNYYLLRNGRRIGKDSLYQFDFTPDCESEGKILFADRKHQTVGFFNGQGRVVIPAQYRWATPFRNGISFAYRGGKRKCWSDKDCEHWSWVDGETVLINERNEVLARGYKTGWRELDPYSMQTNPAVVDTSTWFVIPGEGGNRYAFIDQERAFKKWFDQTFVPALAKGDAGLRPLLFDEIVFYHDTGWVHLSANELLPRSPAQRIQQLLQDDPMKEQQVISDMLIDYGEDDKLYHRYLTSCGNPDEVRYPSFSVTITWYKMEQRSTGGVTELVKTTDRQESLSFLKTESGYRLISFPVY